MLALPVFVYYTNSCYPYTLSCITCFRVEPIFGEAGIFGFGEAAIFGEAGDFENGISLRSGRTLPRSPSLGDSIGSALRGAGSFRELDSARIYFRELLVDGLDCQGENYFLGG